jgi:hypothetical protein
LALTVMVIDLLVTRAFTDVGRVENATSGRRSCYVATSLA